jgi:hypothetical protein
MRQHDDSCLLELAATLYRENVRSFNERYPTRAHSEADIVAGISDITRAHIHAWELAPLSVGQMFRALHCFRWQSCEHDAWPTSDGLQLVERMESAAARLLPDYHTCPWGIKDRAPLKRAEPSPHDAERIEAYAKMFSTGS